MTRTSINLAVDLAIAALFLALIATGFVLGFALPPGTNKGLCLWGLSRHQFGNIHLGVSFAFLGARVPALAMGSRRGGQAHGPESLSER